MKIKFVIKNPMVLLAFICLPFFSNAGPGGPGPDPDPAPPPSGASVPLDGGLSILIAAGVGYAAKKGYDKRKLAKGLEK